MLWRAPRSSADEAQLRRSLTMTSCLALFPIILGVCAVNLQFFPLISWGILVPFFLAVILAANAVYLHKTNQTSIALTVVLTVGTITMYVGAFDRQTHFTFSSLMYLPAVVIAVYFLLGRQVGLFYTLGCFIANAIGITIYYAELPDTWATIMVDTNAAILIGSFMGLMIDISRHNQLDLIEKQNEDLLRQREFAYHANNLANVGQLASGVGHQINNPLSIVTLSLERLRRSIPESEQKSIENIQSAVNRIVRIIESLATLSSKEAHPKDTELTLRESLNSIEVVLGGQLMASGIRLRTEITDSTFEVDQPASVAHAVSNMIRNSKEAIEEFRRDGEVTLKVSTRFRFVVIEVIDNGPGIPHQVMNQIFLPFFTTKEEIKSVGLGLSYCFRLVDQNGGRITVKSVPGTRFRMILPQKNTAEIGGMSYPIKFISRSNH